MLPLDTFKTVVASTPLISVDFIIRNSEGKILLGERVNRSAQGYWFAPGGRILKGERILEAVDRLLQEELGLDHAELDFKPSFRSQFQN